MKVYFENGNLHPNVAPDIELNYWIDACYGISHCRKMLEKYSNTSCAVYTNSMLAWNNKYVWNAELEAPELYVRDKHNQSEWIRIDKLTKRVINESHNLLNLYLAGEFNQEKDIEPMNIYNNHITMASEAGYRTARNDWSDAVNNLMEGKYEEYVNGLVKENTSEYYRGYKDAMIDLLDAMKIEHVHVRMTKEG